MNKYYMAIRVKDNKGEEIISINIPLGEDYDKGREVVEAAQGATVECIMGSV